MIAKRVKREKGTSNPARLVRYMVAAIGNLDPTSWARTDDYILARKEMTTQCARVSSYRVTNCGTDDPAAATLLITALQAANTTSKKDKTYHLVYSFPSGEQPQLEVLHAIEDALCAAIGFSDHHRISAVHTDTDHLHVHVAINKVHPIGLQNIEPYYDKKRLMEASEYLEIKYGLQRTNHGLGKKPNSMRRLENGYQRDDGQNRENGARGVAVDIEAQSGIETLAGYVARDVSLVLRKAMSWQALHAAATEHGLEVNLRGAGLVIGDRSIPLWTKASSCGRDLSLKALTDRLGPFEPSRQKQRHKKHCDTVYTVKPRHPGSSSTVLFSQYQRERQERNLARRNGLEQIKCEDDDFNMQLKQWSNTQRMLLKVVAKGLTRRLMLATIKQQGDASRSVYRKTVADRRKTLFKNTMASAWADWLVKQAEKGNAEAVTLLRNQEQREHRWRGDLLTAEKADKAKAVVLERLQPKANKDGTMAYHTIDGGMVLDRMTHVQAQKATTGAALVALELACKRFAQQDLIVEGTAEFRQEVAQLAGMHGFNVRFVDPIMEQLRQARAEAKDMVWRTEINAKNLTPSVRQTKILQTDNTKELAKTETMVINWIAERNKNRNKISDIDYHRAWIGTDAGKAIYQGRRHMADGSTVLLLKSSDEILVKPCSPRIAAKAAKWKLGCGVELDARGRFIDRSNEVEL